MNRIDADQDEDTSWPQILAHDADGTLTDLRPSATPAAVPSGPLPPHRIIAASGDEIR